MYHILFFSPSFCISALIIIALLHCTILLQRIQRLHLLSEVSSLCQQSDDLFRILLIFIFHERIVNLLTKLLRPI